MQSCTLLLNLRTPIGHMFPAKFILDKLNDKTQFKMESYLNYKGLKDACNKNM